MARIVAPAAGTAPNAPSPKTSVASSFSPISTTTSRWPARLNARLSSSVHSSMTPPSSVRTIRSRPPGCAGPSERRIRRGCPRRNRWLGVPSDVPSSSSSMSRPSSTGTPGGNGFLPVTGSIASSAHSMTSGASAAYSKRTLGRFFALLVAKASPRWIVTVSSHAAGTDSVSVAEAGAAVASR